MSESLTDRIQQRLAELGLSERAASLAATGSDATIRMIRTGKSENPRSDTVAKIAEVLKTSPEWLLTGKASGLSDSPGSEVRPSDAPGETLDNLPRDVPVVGTVAGSALGRGAFQLSPDIVDFVRRPYGLLGAKDIYALYVEGESMTPRFEPGDLVFVHPHRRPQPRDYIVIQEPDSNNGEPRGFIKRLVVMKGEIIRTEQFNPPATIDFIVRPGLLVHKVMTDSDLYGV